MRQYLQRCVGKRFTAAEDQPLLISFDRCCTTTLDIAYDNVTPALSDRQPDQSPANDGAMAINVS